MAWKNKKHEANTAREHTSVVISPETQNEMLKVTQTAAAHPMSGKYGANVLDRALLSATSFSADKVKRYVDGIRRKNPHASPEQVIAILSSTFKKLLQSTGGAVGASAAIPAVGTATALVLTAADLSAFFAAASLYSLAVAEVHGIDTDDPDRRKALLLATVLGDQGAKTVSGFGNVPLARWGTALMTSMPKSSIKQVNKVLTSRFIKRKLATHSGLALGRVAPFGIGAAVGIAGGRALANTVIHQAQRAFGPAPTQFARDLEPVIL